MSNVEEVTRKKRIPLPVIYMVAVVMVALMLLLNHFLSSQPGEVTRADFADRSVLAVTSHFNKQVEIVSDMRLLYCPEEYNPSLYGNGESLIIPPQGERGQEIVLEDFNMESWVESDGSSTISLETGLRFYCVVNLTLISDEANAGTEYSEALAEAEKRGFREGVAPVTIEVSDAKHRLGTRYGRYKGFHYYLRVGAGWTLNPIY